MNQVRIRIRTARGKIITRQAEVIDKIDDQGRQYSIALHGGHCYTVLGRDFYGPIYAKKKHYLTKTRPQVGPGDNNENQ